MEMRPRTLSRNFEPIDEYFDSLGLFRKCVPKDASSLFRAVAEQVCMSQSRHNVVRNLALDYMLIHRNFFQTHLKEPLDSYILKMRNIANSGSLLELEALSLIFKVNIIVYEDNGKTETMVGFSFPPLIRLYRDSVGQFDIIYTLERGAMAAFCQHLVYDMLYSKVFKMENIEGIVDKMLHGSTLRQDSVHSEREASDISKIVQNCLEALAEGLDYSMESCDSPITEKGMTPPFPYRVAKALDPDIYRNTEYDIWIAIKREARYGPYDSRGIQIGAKVIVKGNVLNFNSVGLLHGHVQSVTENRGPVEVFVEELGRRAVFPYSAIEKVPSSPTSTGEIKDDSAGAAKEQTPSRAKRIVVPIRSSSGTRDFKSPLKTSKIRRRTTSLPPPLNLRQTPPQRIEEILSMMTHQQLWKFCHRHLLLKKL